MIDVYFAEKFIESIGQYMDERFMVFNTKGIIIAATEHERVGDFHEASFNMFKKGLDIIKVSEKDIDKYLGVKPGIDMPIRHDGKVAGGVGITGPIDHCLPLITMAKLMFEAMLDYEVHKEKEHQKFTLIDSFAELLMDFDKESEGKLESEAKRLDFKTNIPRICILFVPIEDLILPQSIYHIVSDYRKLDSQDILFINKNKEVVLFKSLPFVKKDIFSGYKEYIESFIPELRTKFLRESLPVMDYIGTMQTHLEYYKYSHKHCLWMQENRYSSKYFYDHVDEYIESLIPAIEYNGIYDSISGLLTPTMRENYRNLFGALRNNNYNLALASQELHVHKNTLVFQLNKYRELFNMNPVQSNRDRNFFTYFESYFHRVKKGKK